LITQQAAGPYHVEQTLGWNKTADEKQGWKSFPETVTPIEIVVAFRKVALDNILYDEDLFRFPAGVDKVLLLLS